MLGAEGGVLDGGQQHSDVGGPDDVGGREREVPDDGRDVDLVARAAERGPPERDALLLRRDGDVELDRRGDGPRRVPGVRGVRDDRPARLQQQPQRRPQPRLGSERVERAQHEPAAAELGLPQRRPHHRHELPLLGEQPEVDHDRWPGGPRERRRGVRRSRAAAGLAHVDQQRPVLQRAGEGLADRPGQGRDRDQQVAQHRVERVLAEQRAQHDLGQPERPVRQRALADLDQPLAHEQPVGAEQLPHPRVPLRQRREPAGQPDGHRAGTRHGAAALGEVLEQVDAGCGHEHGHRQVVEPEDVRDRPQHDRPVRGVGLGLRVQRHRRHVSGQRGAVEQPPLQPGRQHRQPAEQEAGGRCHARACRHARSDLHLAPTAGAYGGPSLRPLPFGAGHSALLDSRATLWRGPAPGDCLPCHGRRTRGAPMATQYLSPGVYVEEMPPQARPIQGVGTSVAAFVGLAAQGPFDEPVLVTDWGQFTRTFGDFVDGSYLAHSVYGYFANGGATAYVVRVGAGGGNGNGNGNGGPAELTSGATAEIGSASDPRTPVYRVSAAEPGDVGNELSVDIEASTPEGGGDETYTVSVKRGAETVESFEGLTAKKGRTNVATAVTQRSKLIALEELAHEGTVDLKPATGTVPLSGGGVTAAPQAPGATAIVGSSADRTGVGVLETLEDVTMVCVPDLVAAYEQGAIDLEGFKTVQSGVISHCELMGDRLAILDAPPGLNAQKVKDWRLNQAGYDSKFAVVYWPQIKVLDPLTGKNRFVPPSGHMAGVWARTDTERGVHKAPANEVVRGAVDLELAITRGEHDQLNPIGVNVIRAFPGRGVRVWGARTLSSDAAWRYVNVRRLFNFVQSSILSNLDWVVFEPNDADLWARITRDVSAFLTGVWRTGALFGSTPSEAFFVRCDATTNPPDSIEAGYVITEVGMAITKPAEFVVFRLANLPTGGAVAEG